MSAHSPEPGDVYAVTVHEPIEHVGFLTRLMVRLGLFCPPTQGFVYMRMVEEVTTLAVIYRTPDDRMRSIFRSDWCEWAEDAVQLAKQGVPEPAAVIREHTGLDALPFELDPFQGFDPANPDDADLLKVGGSISED